MPRLMWTTTAGLGLAAAGCLAVPKWATPDPVAAQIVSAPDLDQADQALALAADCLDRDDEPAAIPHLQTYLRANPSAHLTRLHLAELMYRHADADQAVVEFERFLHDAPLTGPAHAKRTQCHTRLMALAEARGDDFTEHLHRGAGLLSLAEKWATEPTPDGPLVEQTAARAVAALHEARDIRPQDARANLYLAQALDVLGQPAAADAVRQQARRGLPDLHLTAAELMQLAE